MPKYTDTPNFNDATFLANDPGLQFAAPSQVYSGSGVYREWVNTGQSTGNFTATDAVDCIVRPKVEMVANQVTDIDFLSFKLSANVVSDGGAQVTNRGFLLIPVSENDIPSIDSTNANQIQIEAGSGTGSFSASTGNVLKATTQYYIRAYAYGVSYTNASAADKPLTVGYSGSVAKSTSAAHVSVLSFGSTADGAC